MLMLVLMMVYGHGVWWYGVWWYVVVCNLFRRGPRPWPRARPRGERPLAEVLSSSGGGEGRGGGIGREGRDGEMERARGRAREKEEGGSERS